MRNAQRLLVDACLTLGGGHADGWPRMHMI